MAEHAIIPKLLPVRTTVEYIQKVPRIIWQTMKTNVVPAFMKSYADSWMELNPEYEYRFYDDDDIVNFLKTDFPEYIDSYNKLKYGASKADLWRYLIMYKYGGVYADIDCKCIRPLRDWIEPEAALVTQLGTNKDICQWLIISEPQNPVFLAAAQKILQNLRNNNCKAAYYGFDFINNELVLRKNVPLIKFDHEVLGLSGPPVLQEATEKCLKEGLLSFILPFTQVVCVSGITSCQMNGNAIHDTGDIEYKKAYNSMKLNHYNTRFEKIKRKIGRFFNQN